MSDKKPAGHAWKRGKAKLRYRKNRAASRNAYTQARKLFGKRAQVRVRDTQTNGYTHMVGVTEDYKGMSMFVIKGTGRSWDEAFRHAERGGLPEAVYGNPVSRFNSIGTDLGR